MEDPILPQAGVVHLIPPIGGAPERKKGRRGGHKAAPRRGLIVCGERTLLAGIEHEGGGIEGEEGERETVYFRSAI